MLASRHGPRPPLIAGLLLMIVGLLAMLALDDDTPTALILLLLIPLGAGGGLGMPPLTAALLEALPPERAALAGGVFNAARQFGGGLGVALFGGLIASRVHRGDARRAAPRSARARRQRRAHGPLHPSAVVETIRGFSLIYFAARLARRYSESLR